MSKEHTIKSILGLIITAALAATLIVRLNTGRQHRDRSLKIDQTSVIVTQIRQISRFVTACWYEDVVMDDSKPSRYFGTDNLCIIVKGTVRAGYDFSHIGAESVSIAGDTLKVKLPDPKILEVIVNPSGTEVYDESGSWSHDEIRALTNKARARLINDANAAGILVKAGESARSQLEDLFLSFGFKTIDFE